MLNKPVAVMVHWDNHVSLSHQMFSDNKMHPFQE